MPHVIFYFQFMDDRLYLTYNLVMKKIIVLTILFGLIAVPSIAEEQAVSPEKPKINKVKLFKNILGE